MRKSRSSLVALAGGVFLALASLSLVSPDALAARWGDLKKDACSGDGTRQHSARLWDIEGDWVAACRETPVFVAGVPHRAARCPQPAGQQWGEFDLPDASCATSGTLKINLRKRVFDKTLCLSPEIVDGAARTDNGARIRQYPCDQAGIARNWSVTRHKLTGWYQLRNTTTHKCLDAANVAAGAVVHQWDCHDGENQAWRTLNAGVEHDMGKYYWSRFELQVRNASNSYCLGGDQEMYGDLVGAHLTADSPGFRVGDGFTLHYCLRQNDPHDDPISRHYFDSVELGTVAGMHAIANVRGADGQTKLTWDGVVRVGYAGATDLSSRAGTLVGDAQRWELVPFGDSGAQRRHQIRQVGSDLCLFAISGALELRTCGPSTAGLWTIWPAKSPFSTTEFWIRNVADPRYLSVGDDAKVTLSSESTTSRQHWVFVAQEQFSRIDGLQWNRSVPLGAMTLTTAAPSPLRDYLRPAGPLPWGDALERCVGSGMRLCDAADICQQGEGKPPAHGQPEGDVWMAVGDAPNAWIAIGTKFPDRLCRRHEHLGGPPSWGTTTGPEAVTGTPAAMMCCAL